MRLRWSLLAVVLAGLVAGCSSSAESGSSARELAPQRSSDYSTAKQDLSPDQQDFSTDQRREVIRTAELDVEVDDVAGASAEVRRRAEAVGGYLEQETGYRSSNTMTVRIPAAELDRALGELSGLGRVTSRSQQAEDVTEQLVDTRSRIESQQASVQRLRELMARAETVSDIVSIESELTSRETELESLQRREAAMSSQVQLATVTVRLESPAVVADEDTGFLAGLSAGWRGLTATGAVILTTLGAVLPFAAALVVPAFGLHLWLRRRKALKKSL
ncbi:protein of unknown function [Saccharopolyspora kobensis]|uniref:DUF4349 domain-containing protein n=1 Tax=Saccharopolyspora kobensis TaxID=146035 RepID=A0A1H6DXQ4_9PSEU|nr:DUF4349 domain-containing protein [Saccharopolyspora kobensis]SEG90117.1 protein of unknown function [Saccharopolyspora kobensis]SFD89130.1 protein of unknown function [Saccharopolyspora kobensis]